ncbi:glycine dehydrogenase [Sphingomonas melonis TY]|uniref:Probable glycine dehydrogenase (decarboxylating) subunit 1 n=1 Tax=Sphingomonas melonis TY TaxID=621456 RepID=A0A175Y7R4_9SPHN|nr:MULTISPECIES: aminomethyl-transferring glycine dehydrogenase subunit GcvPA [Sphingomonas]AOW25425.1 glycine dehydrogenase (aminomethyl-transferring) [Sphingomonas melonis TY]ATI57405.1 aminomethyl-transferring glycine dehydrogenase [Sphingomonas melonis]KZB96040.1 glycine dehydrogenase [Sphingomonas melonis TY]MBI0532434.1 aminomethyl-transferring glycine dehydrogenase subunit GcvPA [Sphingomonas sp. TX0522]MBX8844158.1 aminomethyl-transferring glycine dehydrogenase subunit GcvPA [Sphingomo
MRYLPLTQTDREAMLSVIGAASIDDLFVDVPEAARLDGPVHGLPNHATELAVERHMAKLARANTVAGEVPFFLGAGAYRHHVPATVDHLIQRGEFLTAYTPYQPEIAQGTLQMLFEFQTQVARLLGTDVANASMYDGSTACWEAIGMARRITKRGKAILSAGLHPHYVSVAKTMAKYTGDTLDTTTPWLTGEMDIDRLIEKIDGDTSCVVVQYPDILGRIADLTPLADACHKNKALLIAVVTEPVAMGAIRSPGEMDADIVVGEGQSLGVGLQFGGPYVGLMGCKEKYIRQMPGRFCGETVDADGKRGFVLTLSTREQHIRREKATSNICTNSGLCALAFSIHMTLLGEAGLRRLAAINHAGACRAADRLSKVPGVELVTQSFFNEFTLKLPNEARPVVRTLADRDILAGVSLGRLYPGEDALANGLIVAVTETTTTEDVETLAAALEEVLA